MTRQPEPPEDSRSVQWPDSEAFGDGWIDFDQAQQHEPYDYYGSDAQFTHGAGTHLEEGFQPQWPSQYSFDFAMDVPQSSIEQHVPVTESHTPPTFPPSGQSDGQDRHPHGLPGTKDAFDNITSHTLPQTIDPQLLAAAQPDRSLFSGTMASAYGQNSPAYVHQQSRCRDSRSVTVPYYQLQSTSDIGDRSQYGTPDLSNVHDRVHDNSALQVRGNRMNSMNSLSSPAFFSVTHPSLPIDGYTPGDVISSSLSPSRLPERNLYQAYQNQYQTTPLGDTQLDASPSPYISNARQSQSVFSPEPTSLQREEINKLLPAWINHKTARQCQSRGCKIRFKKTRLSELCSRCAMKKIRHDATPVQFSLDSEIPDFEAAKNAIYPPVLGKGPPISAAELREMRAREDSYVQLLLDATNTVVPGGEVRPEDDIMAWPARQQMVFNEKSRIEDGYSSEQITARLRGLFAEAVDFHVGAAKSFYPVGGDMAGYTPDTKLNFEDRFRLICEILRVNKRIVMDVIEGRGVKGFVGNPVHFNKRKESNNNCNEVKKGVMELGKRVIGEEGEGDVGGQLGSGKKKTTTTTTTTTRGKGRKRKRVLSPVEEQPETQEAAMQQTGAGPSTWNVEYTADAEAESTYPLAEGSDRDYEPVMSDEFVYGSGRSRTMEWLRPSRGGGRRGRS